MARVSIISMSAFSTGDEDYLTADIYEYIGKKIFNSKTGEKLITKDVIKFVSDNTAVELAKSELELTEQELLSYVIKYFSEHTDVKYHPLTLAKQIRKQRHIK